MKAKLIDMLVVVVILFSLVLIVFVVAGCDDEPVYGYVMSEIHFWDETCQKEIVGPTIQPACYFLCNTCSNIWAVDPNRNVRILDAYELFEFCKKYRKEFEFDERYMREKFSVYDTTMTDMIDRVEVKADKDLIHEQEVVIMTEQKELDIYFDDNVDTNAEGYKGDGSTWKNAINDLDLIN